MRESGQRQFYKNTVTNVRKIFTVLKESSDSDEGYLSVSEISRRSGLHKWIVSRTVDIWMAPFLDVVIPEELDQIGLKIKLVRLAKPELTEERVLRGLRIRMLQLCACRLAEQRIFRSVLFFQISCICCRGCSQTRA